MEAMKKLADSLSCRQWQARQHLAKFSLALCTRFHYLPFQDRSSVR
jgi:hypothetical protein